MSTAIKVENIGKLYRLGEVGTGALMSDAARWFAKLRGKEDPYLKVGEANDRTQKGNSDFVWAIKNISFDIQQGEVLGIIGKNGAGKSTLLKILSRTTTPTEGSIKVKGKIASLLEVGTGFHPDLTGRDNVFLNGAILGMSKREIASKFDEIVSFSGVERYIDTPVKRYSSGMYVRLAFAVAAHLESDILVVDEVLAVGDAEFQKKCLGKMQDVSRENGRTILFVSHNMKAIKALCTKGVILTNGHKTYEGNIDDCARIYLSDQENTVRNLLGSSITAQIQKQKQNDVCEFTAIEITQNNRSVEIVKSNEPLKITIQFQTKENISGLRVFFDICDEEEDLLIRSFHDEHYQEAATYTLGNHSVEATIPANIFPPKELYGLVKLGIYNERIVQEIRFKIQVELTSNINIIYPGDPVRSKVLPLIHWQNS